LKLRKRECRGQIRAKFFSMRIVNVWNSLTKDIVQAPYVNCIKGRLDRPWASIRFCECGSEGLDTTDLQTDCLHGSYVIMMMVIKKIMMMMSVVVECPSKLRLLLYLNHFRDNRCKLPLEICQNVFDLTMPDTMKVMLM
jgi:hypothetical protein